MTINAVFAARRSPLYGHGYGCDSTNRSDAAVLMFVLVVPNTTGELLILRYSEGSSPCVGLRRSFGVPQDDILSLFLRSIPKLDPSRIHSDRADQIRRSRHCSKDRPLAAHLDNLRVARRIRRRAAIFQQQTFKPT